MASVPADIGVSNSLTIPPNLPVTYASSDLLVDIESSGDSGLVYFGSNLADPPGESFNWSFLDYNQIIPLSGTIQQTSTGPDATFVVPAGETASFELVNPFVPDVPPTDVAIDSLGPAIVLHQNINTLAPIGTPDEGLAQGITLFFDDPLVASGTVTWG